MSIIDDSILGGGSYGGGGSPGPPPPPGYVPPTSSSVSSSIGSSSGHRIRELIRKRYLGAPPPPPSVMGLQPFQTAAASPAAAAAPSPTYRTGAGPTQAAVPTAAAPAAAAPAPAFSGYSDPGTADYGAGLFGSLSSLLRGFQGAGTFAPGPNQAIMELVRALALQDAEAARARNALAAQSLGVDPATAASFALRSDLESQGGVAEALSRASLGELTHQRDFGQQLLLALLGRQGTQNAYNPQRATDVIGSVSGLLPRGGYTLE